MMWPFRKKSVDEEFSNIGNILKKLSLIDEDVLSKAVEEQARERARGATPKKLGEVLVDLGAISLADLKVALDLQMRLRRGGTDGVLALAEAQVDEAKRGAARLSSTLTMPVINLPPAKT